MSERLISMFQEAMDLSDIVPVEIPVQYGGKHYILREASGQAIVEWQNAMFSAARLGPDGRPTSLDGAGNADMVLLALSLYEADEEGKLRTNKLGYPDPRYLVPQSTIKAWPGRVQDRLLKRLRVISEMDEGENEETLTKRIEELQTRLNRVRALRKEEAPKKEPPDTTDGSE
jgi:hypothetical protein